MRSKDNLQIKCIWCNAVWTAEMELMEISISAGCDSCGYGATAEGAVEITCNNCHKVVYRKEFNQEA